MQTSVRALLIGGGLAVAGLSAATVPAVAQTIPLAFPQTRSPPRPPVDPAGESLIRADQVLYDRENEIITASGLVEISQGDRVLRSDTISWNRRTGVVTATGNLILMEPNGEVIFGEYAELTEGLKEGIIKEMRMLMTDNTRIAASGGQRTNGDRKEFTKAVFSPCDLCPIDPNRAPLWQLKAERVIHDETAKDVIYRDVQMELFGVPIFYSPYLSHPDPTVKRRSGVLPPTLKQSSTLGSVTGLPYYYVIDETSDATVELRNHTRQGPMIAGEFREQFSDSKLRVVGSIVNARRVAGTDFVGGRELRGNLAIEGLWAIDENWRARLDLARYSDATYARAFSLESAYRESRDNQADIASTAQVEGFFGASYAQIAAYGFQTLRPEVRPATLPIVHPYALYSWVGAPDSMGGGFKVDVSGLALSRQIGADSTRLNTFSAYQIPFRTSWGARIDLAGTFQADVYQVANVPEANGTSFYNGSVTRAQPQVAAFASWPLIRQMDRSVIELTPKVGVFVSPRGNNPSRIPIEDSIGFEFDETSLFSLRRYAGYDRVFSGQRVDYALEGVYRNNGRAIFDAVIGQSARAERDTTLSANSGLTESLSDIVGRVSVYPTASTRLLYRFRYDKDTFESNREEFSAQYAFGRSYGSLSYVRFAQPGEFTSTSAQRLAGATLVTQLLDYWSVYTSLGYDLKKGEPTSGSFAAIYRDECFAIALGITRNLQSQRDLKNDTTFFLRFGLKHLSTIGS